MAVYEGAWDCPSCGTERNRGPHKHCPACGAGRGADVEIYLPKDAREVQDEAELSRAQAGPDWTCAYCQVDNLATAQFCVNCGAGQDGSAPRKVTETLFEQPATAPPPAPGCKPNTKKLLLGCVGFPILMFLLLLWMAMPTRADLTVLGHSWQRIIQTEEYKNVSESDWEGSVPSGATKVRESRELHHTDKIQTGTTTKTRTVSERVQVGTERVKTGTRNKGNGYFEDVYENRPKYENKTRTETYQEPVYRDEPVYRTKVYYTIWKWTAGNDVNAQGEGLNAAWPTFRPDDKHREKARVQRYLIKLADKKQKNYTYETKEESEWRSFEVGKTYHGKVSGTKCVELKPGAE